jgi:two-component system sensor histidine kinase/response regulator
MASRPDESGAERLAQAAQAREGLPVLDVAAALRRLGGDRALLQRLLRDLTREWTDLPARVQRLRTEGDLTTARRAAHTLKGASGSLGAMELAAAAGELERALDSADAEAVDPALARLGERLVALGALVAARVPDEKEAPAPPASPFTAGELDSALEELACLLARRNLRARELLGRLRGEALPAACHVPFAALVEHIARLDFAAAELALARVRARLGAPGPEPPR